MPTYLNVNLFILEYWSWWDFPWSRCCYRLLWCIVELYMLLCIPVIHGQTRGTTDEYYVTICLCWFVGNKISIYVSTSSVWISYVSNSLSITFVSIHGFKFVVNSLLISFSFIWCLIVSLLFSKYDDHWCKVVINTFRQSNAHICISDLPVIGSDNGLSPGQHQAIMWTNAGILLIGPLGTNISDILIKIHTFSFKKMHLKMSSAKWGLFCLSLNVLKKPCWL